MSAAHVPAPGGTRPGNLDQRLAATLALAVDLTVNNAVAVQMELQAAGGIAALTADARERMITVLTLTEEALHEARPQWAATITAEIAMSRRIGAGC